MSTPWDRVSFFYWFCVWVILFLLGLGQQILFWMGLVEEGSWNPVPNERTSVPLSYFEAVRTKSCKDCIWREILLCIISRARELDSTWVCTM